jgi:hypothetical protein
VPLVGRDVRQTDGLEEYVRCLDDLPLVGVEKLDRLIDLLPDPVFKHVAESRHSHGANVVRLDVFDVSAVDLAAHRDVSVARTKKRI